jgi:Prophage tail length tape measure protein
MSISKGVNFTLNAQNNGAAAMRGFQNGLRGVGDSLKSARDSMNLFVDRANKLRATFVPAFAETVRFRDSVKDLDEAQRIGAISAVEYASALASIKANHQDKMGSFQGVPKSAMDSISVFGSEMDRLRNKFDPISAATTKYQTEVQELETALRMGAIGTDQYNAALAKLRATLETATTKAATFNSTIQNTINSVNRVNAPSRSAAESMSAFGSEMDGLRDRFNPAASAMARYESELKDLNYAHRLGVVDAKGYAEALRRLQTAAVASGATNTSMMRGMSANRRAFQQIGFQVTDFSVQIAGGQSAMLAFIQQGGQVLQFFGLWGAVMAGFLSVFGTLAYIFVKTGHSIGELRSALGVLPIEMEALRAIAAAVRDAFIDMANVLINNLDRIIIYAGVLVAFFAGRWVMAMLAAATGVGSLSAALVFLRGAIMRTGFGVIIIAIGELVYRFMQLVDAVGGFGTALGMIKDVALEVFDRIVLSMGLLPAAMSAAANNMAAFFIGKLQDMVYAFMDFTDGVAQGLNELFGTSLQGADLTQLSGDLDQVRLDFKSAGIAAENSYGAMMSGVRAPLASVKALSDAIAKVKDGSIDVRDLWGGATADEDGKGKGGGSQVDKVKEEVDKIKKMYEDLSSSISSTMQQGFKSVLKGTMSVTDYLSDVLDKIADQIFDILMTPVFNKISGGIAGGIMRAIGMPSFAGGGGTGNGSRSGGLDGQGGFMALLHPQETVVDHAMGQSMRGGSGGTVEIIVRESPSFASSVETIARDSSVKITRAGIQEYDTKQLATSMMRVQSSPRMR